MNNWFFCARLIVFGFIISTGSCFILFPLNGVIYKSKNLVIASVVLATLHLLSWTVLCMLTCYRASAVPSDQSRNRPPKPKHISTRRLLKSLYKIAPLMQANSKDEALRTLRKKIKNESEPIELEQFDALDLNALRTVIIIDHHGYLAENIVKWTTKKLSSPLNPKRKITPLEIAVAKYVVAYHQKLHIVIM